MYHRLITNNNLHCYNCLTATWLVRSVIHTRPPASFRFPWIRNWWKWQRQATKWTQASNLHLRRPFLPWTTKQNIGFSATLEWTIWISSFCVALKPAIWGTISYIGTRFQQTKRLPTCSNLKQPQTKANKATLPMTSNKSDQFTSFKRQINSTLREIIFDW